MTGIYSDLELVSAKKTYAAHRVIVCLRSSVISKSCDFKDVCAIRDDSGVCRKVEPLAFNFLDDDPQSVDCVVQYFYGLDYKRPDSTFGLNAGAEEIQSGETAEPIDIADSDDSDLLLHVKVYALAEKYDIPPLKELSLSKFEEAVRKYWKSDHFSNAAREAYTSTVQEDEGMRTAVVKTFYAHEELLDKEHMRELLQELPQLTYDLLIHHHKRKERSMNLFGNRTFS